MRINSELLLCSALRPFEEVVGLRATIVADYSERVFKVYGNSGQTSWGIAFVTKEGYFAVKPSNGLSAGVKDGYTFWVSTNNRPATMDYTFEVKKGEKTLIYRVIVIVEEE